MALYDALSGEPLIAYRLIVQGLPARFSWLPEGVEMTEDDVPGTSSALQYTDLNDMLAPNGWTDELDPIGGIGRAGAMQIEILSDELDGELSDAGLYLSALPGPSTIVGQMTASATATDTTIYIDRDASGESLPRIVHIGHEAMWCTAAAGAQPDPNVANPYRLTVVRGVAETKAAEHSVNEGLNIYPDVHRDLVGWIRRRARVEAAPIYGHIGQALLLGEWVELRRGVIERAPEPADDGGGFTLSLVPLIGILDTEMETAPSFTELVKGYHYFDGEIASGIEWAIFLNRIGLGRTYDSSAADSGKVYIDTSIHSQIFDTSLDPQHPRSGALFLGGVNQVYPYPVEDYSDAGVGPPDESINLVDGPPADIADDQIIMSTKASELKRVTFSGTLEWPGEVFDEWASTATASPDGIDGAWADLYPIEDDNGGYVLGLHNNILQYGIGGRQSGPHAVMWDMHKLFLPVRHPDNIAPLGWDGADSSRAGVRQDFYYTADGPQPRFNCRSLLYYPLFRRRGVGVDEGDRDGDVNWLTVWSYKTESSEKRNIIETPEAFYQIGETTILVEKDLGDANTPFPIRVLHQEPWNNRYGAAFTQIIPNPYAEIVPNNPIVTAIDPIALPNGDTAYQMTIRSPDYLFSFGDWPGLEPAIIERVTFGGDTSASEIIVSLLAEAGLDGDDVDLESIRRFDDPIGIKFSQPVINEPTELRDVLDPILICTGTALVMRTDSSGKNRVTRVSVGAENPIESMAILSDDDMLDSAKYGVDDSITNTVVIASDYQYDGEPLHTRTFNNTAYAAESSGDPQSVELALYGAFIEDAGDLLITAQRVFESVGRPRRVWSIRLPIDAAWDLFPGAVVRLSSDVVRGYGSIGVNGLYGRVTSINFVLEQGEVELVIQHTGTNGTGWNASMLVDSVVNGTTVEIDTAAFVPEFHPVTGEALSSLDFWAVGDDAFARPIGDHDSITSVTIDNIDTGTSRVTFTGAHNLVSGGTIDPPAYDDASEVHKDLAYMADDVGTLGAGGDAGQQAG